MYRNARPPYLPMNRMGRTDRADRINRTNGYGNHRPPYRPPYRIRYGVPLGLGWTGYAPWLGLGYWDYPGDYANDYDDSQAPPYYDGYDPQSEPQSADSEPYQQSQPRPYYQPTPDATQAPLPQTSVTLVFKDGRPSEQIHNYLLSRNTLSIYDQSPRQIPVDQLDLTATEKTNREAGVDFRLPKPPGN